MRQTKIEFTQEGHCCLLPDDHPSLSMELMDGGGGEFLVLHAAHWALDTPEEVDMLAAEMKAMLAKARAD